MKMIKDSLLVLFTLVLSLGAYVPAYALDAGVSVSGSVNVGSDKGENGISAQSTTSAAVEMKGEENDNSNSKQKGSEDANMNASATASTTVSSEADEHRSVVATFVQGLLSIANRDGGIGAQVRTIARDQDDSSTTTVESMNQVEARSSLKTFLIGSDYKNLGVIRSESAKTDNRIQELSALASSTTDVTVKAQLNSEIKLLTDDQVKVNAFVTAHENTFSLFGWFVKLFNK